MVEAAYIVLACALAAAAVYRLGVLTAHGAAATFLIGVFIWQFRGLEWLVVLASFFVAGAAATRWRYAYKERVGVAERRKGKRSIENVIGSSYAPLLFVLFSSPLGFLASVAAAMADNLASEVGVLSKRVRIITTLKKVPPGTDGGVSLFGEFVALLGAAAIAALAPLLGVTSPAAMVLVTISGFAGSQFDSLLGATVERRGLVGKTEVNVAATLFGGLFALGLAYLGLDTQLSGYLATVFMK